MQQCSQWSNIGCKESSQWFNHNYKLAQINLKTGCKRTYLDEDISPHDVSDQWLPASGTAVNLIGTLNKLQSL